MSNLNMYCITLNDTHLNKIKKIGYIPVGLGDAIKSNVFFKDDKKCQQLLAFKFD